MARAGSVPAYAMRPLAGDEDYWRLRDLLRQAMILNDRREHSWHVARLDYWWWFANPDLEHLAPEAHCRVAFVGGYSEAANALYGSVMGPEHDISEPWEKLA